jgi:tetratricopeptide (TPR) repeat protein
LFDEGNRLYQQGDYNGALGSYLRIVEAGLESGELYYNIGNAYFKLGDLGHSIVYYERAHRLLPRDQDLLANLELARSLTADEITPLPGFWLFRVVAWWVNLLAEPLLIVVVAAAYLLSMGTLMAVILRRGTVLAAWGRWVAIAAAAVAVVFGSNLAVRELGIGQSPEAVVIVEEVPVHSAPTDDSSLIVFTIHEGTKVRIDRSADDWLEIVLADGKVGWVRSDVVETI